MAQATISVTIDGTTYPATYELKGGIVTVRTDIGTKFALMGNNLPDIIARVLLRELIEIERLRRENII
jgi:hypothetical protein